MLPAQVSKERLYHLLKTKVGIKDSLEVIEKINNNHQSPELAIDGEMNKIDELEFRKVVNAHDFIINLENGYDTEVGEGGGQLSSGQKQLISFARAILANPQVLVMDEATSSVDPETEHLIHEGLPKVLKNRTSFIIAHRLSTIRRADRILFIDSGVIEEQGSHEELMSLGQKYKELYEKQFMHYKEQEILGRSVGFN